MTTDSRSELKRFSVEHRIRFVQRKQFFRRAGITERLINLPRPALAVLQSPLDRFYERQYFVPSLKYACGHISFPG